MPERGTMAEILQAVRKCCIPTGMHAVHLMHAALLGHGFDCSVLGSYLRDCRIGIRRLGMDVVIHAKSIHELERLEDVKDLAECDGNNLAYAAVDTVWLDLRRASFVARCRMPGIASVPIRLIGMSEMPEPSDIALRSAFGVDQIASGADGRLYYTPAYKKDHGDQRLAVRGWCDGDSHPQLEVRMLYTAIRIGFSLDWKSFPTEARAT